MAYLILVRHGESQWNKEGKWTGWTDIDLNETGIQQAQLAGEAIKDLPISRVYTSPLIRAKHTLSEILKVINKTDLPVTEESALTEKNYGDYTGKNKWEVKKEAGEEEFQKIRRSWDYQLPNGESLKQVYERVVNFYTQTLLPQLKEGNSLLVTSHGNTLRAFVKYLDNVSDADVPSLEIATGEVYIYEIDATGTVVKKEVRASHPNLV